MTPSAEGRDGRVDPGCGVGRAAAGAEQVPVEVVDRDRDRRVPLDQRRDLRRRADHPGTGGAAAQVVVARGRPVVGEHRHPAHVHDQPVDQLAQRVGDVVVAVGRHEVRLGRGQGEAGRDRQTQIHQVEPLAVGADVAEVRVEVQQPGIVEEAEVEAQPPLHHGGGRGDRRRPGREPVEQPVGQAVRDVLQEQHDARRCRGGRLDPFAHRGGAVQELDRAVDVGEFVGQRRAAGQHPPVVQQGERLGAPRAHPVGGHRVRGHLPPHPEPRVPADAVLAVRRQVEQVRRGAEVLRAAFPVAERDPLDEHRRAVDLQQRRGTADAVRQRPCPVHQPYQLLVGPRRERLGDRAVPRDPGIEPERR
ncbi:hypothetical protein AB0I55_19745 [Actinocatenispora sera]|uniref:hypothetical protein n=1 Tax=Actinocatenispora sera TaxID=390989 RepID=UPI0033CF5F74